MDKNEKIDLLTLPNKMGVSMLKSHYDRIADFISATLECQTQKRIKLNDLLDKAKEDLDEEFNGNVSWYLLHVKNDMVARGLITVVFNHQRKQMIIKGVYRNPKYRKRGLFYTQDILYFT